MEKSFNIGRRAFVAMGVAAAAGEAKAQSKVVKARIVKGDPDPLRDVVKPADDELEAAIRTLEETAMSDEEKRRPALHGDVRVRYRRLPSEGPGPRQASRLHSHVAQPRRPLHGRSAEDDAGQDVPSGPSPGARSSRRTLSLRRFRGRTTPDRKLSAKCGIQIGHARMGRPHRVTRRRTRIRDGGLRHCALAGNMV